MTEFILNEETIATDQPSGMVLLDFIRYHKQLMGTKIGCREGDCGACTILVGVLKNDRLVYSSATSCLMPLGNAKGKHIVTIEGINFPSTSSHPQPLNPIQQAMLDEGATQCGFCTPGFVMSLAGFCLSNQDPKNIISAIDGNICRCTGYKSIERAAQRIAHLLDNKKNQDACSFVTEKKILPAYFSGVREKLISLQLKTNGQPENLSGNFLGGGTDLYVQKHDDMKDMGIQFLFDRPKMKEVRQEGNKCMIGASATVTDLKESAIIQKYFPAFDKYSFLVSSTPIRNMATLAGNFANASPIGDFTIFFLALNAQLVLTDGKGARTIPLRKFYKGYKILNKKKEENIDKIMFELPDKQDYFHFEKVSRRTNLDIASVNTAISLKKEKQMIFDASISAGGVGPIPLFLEKTSAFLKGKIVNPDLVAKTISLAQAEISPISDARGSAAYKTFLLGQLIKAHFMKIFPELDPEKLILMNPEL